ncbi:Glucose-methanol-choline oxidoreductase [Niveomyces insectorum RCEF 264]|uniref:Glucose-methanol-choline oxidoreductase n=1 Tax=Niveomyces insectorum RCEF 264 TaxID=1081102 RepID=A0A167UPT5_9HYPO|nr:Glucose-methanol-choline oxidoreductase [Niveomyces insectorum RCEF 264]
MWPFARAYPERCSADIDGKTFDYIVVGGGTAGCVLASRLSEDPGVSVLLLERGPLNDRFWTRIPLLTQNYAFSWLPGVTDRYSEPIAACNDRRFPLPTGEALGGTTRLNGLLVTRGVPAGYNEWADSLGLADWGWDAVEPYFRKLETALSDPDKAYRGHHGPLINKRTDLVYQAYSYLAKACAALGLPVEDDCNAPSASAQGYFRLDAAVDTDGTRMSAQRAYLSKRLARQRQRHLTICTNTAATRLQIDATAGRVTGVYATPATKRKDAQNQKIALASARREVIVCGGAFRSPQLLLLRDHLTEMGIEVVRDVPAVGANLADHFAVPIMVELPAKDTVHKMLRPLYGLWTFLLYLLFGKGLLSLPTNAATIFVQTSSLDEATYTVRSRQQQTTHNTDGGSSSSSRGSNSLPAATVDTMDASMPGNIPDVEIMLNPVNCINRGLRGRAYLTFFTTLVQTCVAGRLQLASATDPFAHPAVTYPFLASAADWARMRTAVRFAMRLAREFADHVGYLHPAALTVAPGMDMAELAVLVRLDDGAQPAASAPESANVPVAPARQGEARPRHVDDADGAIQPVANNTALLRALRLGPVQRTWQTVTDAEIDAYMKQVAQSSLHFASTCRMSNDAVGARAGVVDARLRVHGLANLRIADASVFPRIPSAHTMAPTLMVAERCADFIKRDLAASKAA